METSHQYINLGPQKVNNFYGKKIHGCHACYSKMKETIKNFQPKTSEERKVFNVFQDIKNIANYKLRNDYSKKKSIIKELLYLVNIENVTILNIKNNIVNEFSNNRCHSNRTCSRTNSNQYYNIYIITCIYDFILKYDIVTLFNSKRFSQTIHNKLDEFEKNPLSNILDIKRYKKYTTKTMHSL